MTNLVTAFFSLCDVLIYTRLEVEWVPLPLSLSLSCLSCVRSGSSQGLGDRERGEEGEGAEGAGMPRSEHDRSASRETAPSQSARTAPLTPARG